MGVARHQGEAQRPPAIPQGFRAIPPRERPSPSRTSRRAPDPLFSTLPHPQPRPTDEKVCAVLHPGPNVAGMLRHFAPFWCCQRIASMVRRRSWCGVLGLFDPNRPSLVGKDRRGWRCPSNLTVDLRKRVTACLYRYTTGCQWHDRFRAEGGGKQTGASLTRVMRQSQDGTPEPSTGMGLAQRRLWSAQRRARPGRQPAGQRHQAPRPNLLPRRRARGAGHVRQRPRYQSCRPPAGPGGGI